MNREARIPVIRFECLNVDVKSQIIDIRFFDSLAFLFTGEMAAASFRWKNKIMLCYDGA